MDNGAYSQDPERGTELNLVEKSVVVAHADNQKNSVPGGKRRTPNDTQNPQQAEHSGGGGKANSKREGSDKTNSAPGAAGSGGGGGGGAGSSGIDPGPSTSCRPEVCQRARERYTAPDLRGSPWHRTKTIFLLVTIGSLIIWAIVYSTLSKFQIV